MTRSELVLVTLLVVAAALTVFLVAGVSLEHLVAHLQFRVQQ